MTLDMLVVYLMLGAGVMIGKMINGATTGFSVYPLMPFTSFLSESLVTIVGWPYLIWRSAQDGEVHGTWTMFQREDLKGFKVQENRKAMRIEMSATRDAKREFPSYADWAFSVAKLLVDLASETYYENTGSLLTPLKVHLVTRRLVSLRGQWKAEFTFMGDDEPVQLALEKASDKLDDIQDGLAP